MPTFVRWQKLLLYQNYDKNYPPFLKYSHLQIVKKLSPFVDMPPLAKWQVILICWNDNICKLTKVILLCWNADNCKMTKVIHFTWNADICKQTKVTPLSLNNDILIDNKLSPFVRRKVGPVVECPTTDPKIVGTNPSGFEIGLHVFHKPQWARVLVDLFTQEAVV